MVFFSTVLEIQFFTNKVLSKIIGFQLQLLTTNNANLYDQQKYITLLMVQVFYIFLQFFVLETLKVETGSQTIFNFLLLKYAYKYLNCNLLIGIEIIIIYFHEFKFENFLFQQYLFSTMLKNSVFHGENFVENNLF